MECCLAQVALSNGLFHIFVRPERASECARFAMSVGFGGKIDGPDGANKANGIRWTGGRGDIACKAFSKVLMVRAILSV